MHVALAVPLWWAGAIINVGSFRPVMLTRVTEILQRRHAERAPALEKKLAQLAAEQQRCCQEGKRVLQAIGGDDAPATT
jgi:hypothetical protein